jgi:hypothetical protein
VDITNAAYEAAITDFGIDLDAKKLFLRFVALGDGTSGDVQLVSEEAVLTVGNTELKLAEDDTSEEQVSNLILKGQLAYDISSIFGEMFEGAPASLPVMQFTYRKGYTSASLTLPETRQGSYVSDAEHKMFLTYYEDGVYAGRENPGWKCNLCTKFKSSDDDVQFRYDRILLNITRSTVSFLAF